MSETTGEDVNVLQLTLYGRLVGYLAGFQPDHSSPISEL